MIPFPPIVENRSVPMPAERFFIKQARRKPGGPVFYDHKNNTNLHGFMFLASACSDLSGHSGQLP